MSVSTQFHHLATRLPPDLALSLRTWIHRRALGKVPIAALVDNRIGAAFAAVTASEVEPAAAACFERIEARRLELMRSQRPVIVRDFGVRPDGSSSPEGIEVVETEARIVSASYSRPWAELLFQLIRRQVPERCLEMGTCCGISAAYISTALALNGHGRLVTLEGAPGVAEIAVRTLEQVGLKDHASVIVGPFAQTLKPALASLAPLDFVFVDGHHDGMAMLRYFDLINRYLAPSAMLVFDDIRLSVDMHEAWLAIAARPELAIAIDAGSLGIVLLRHDLSPAR